MKEIFNKLKAEMPYKWRKSFDKQNRDLAYIDARDAMDRLDVVLSPENWQCKFRVCPFKYTKIEKGKDCQILDSSTVICSIGINIGALQNKSDNWVWKEGNGTETNIENEKGAFSDAFKRSAVCWGVGRFLYSIKGKPEKKAEYKPAEQKKELQKGSEGVSSNNNNRIISEKQQKLLFAKAKDIPNDVMKDLIKSICGVESSKYIPADKFNLLLEEIEKI